MGHFQSVAVQGGIREGRRYGVIANNLSNSQTVGFKKDHLVFREVIDKASNWMKSEETGRTWISFRQGELQTTGNPLDVAIDGEGFFKIKTPQGIRYTRAGKFELNRDGVLANSNGLPVMGRGGEINVGGKSISIAKDGSIQADGSVVDQLAVVTLPNPSLLKKEGQNLMRLDVPQQEVEGGEGQVVQGALESSNVNTLEEMMKMMDSLRVYESCLKAIQSNDELNAKVVNEVGRV